MNPQTYKKEFAERALSAGFSNDKIEKCLAYSEVLFQNDLPIIYNLPHFSGLVGYEKGYISRVVLFTSYFYKKYKIRKTNGGVRSICEPLPSLKEIQIWLLNNILCKVPVSRFAKAYIKNHNLKNNLTFHRNQSMVISLDIKDFFSSISRKIIQNIFRDLGYSPVLSNLFGKLCCLNGVLPQGAPTSPYLSNLALLDFDDKIGNYCIERRIRFTRYADDMTFSGSNLQPAEIIKKVRFELGKLGLVLNEEKKKIMSSAERQIVTGIVVNEKMQVPKEKRNAIRQEIYYVKKFGLNDHLEHKGNSKNNYIPHLLGRVNFVLHINPNDDEFIEYRKFLQSL
jgi:RNA-directed DNA polymerase